jgi:tight adherence protein B
LGERELLEQLLLIGALGSTILFGSGLFWVLCGESRRASREPRLRALVATEPSPDVPALSLRRPTPQHRALPAALARWLDRWFAATGNRIGKLHLAAASVLGAAAMTALAAAAGLATAPAAMLGGAAALMAPAFLLRLTRKRYRRRFLNAFPDALDLIVRAVRAGLPAPEAIELATRETQPPVGNEFQRMLDEMRIGIDMEEALQSAAERIQVSDFRFFVVNLLLQRQTGGGIAESLANLSTIIRQRKALRQKAQALSAEAKASAAIVATMPFIAGIGLFLINRELMSVMFFDPRGRFMLGLAVASMLAGVVAMKALIDRNLR